jgi:3-oxoacyl-(acyl-carrier-protein) synthase
MSGAHLESGPAVFVAGAGSVSPAGWNSAALWDCVSTSREIPVSALQRPGWERPLRVRKAPVPNPRPAFLNHPRLRRSSPISQFTVAAALEALGSDYPLESPGRVGVVFCTMSGCVNYSRRFFDEAWRDPATASPLLFPETVFNAPSSHIAALLGATAMNYTLVGDPATFLQGLALAAQWLLAGEMDGCLVIGAEETDWVTSEAFRLFKRSAILAEGAGAIYLKVAPGPESRIELRAITDAHLFLQHQSRPEAVRRMREQLPAGEANDCLVGSAFACPSLDRAEELAWQDWPGARLSPKKLLGEGLAAASAWQCVTAIEALKRNRYDSALVSVAGCNQQAIGAQFARAS